MKTIKIFLASSEELDYDRMVFGNLVRRLDDMYEKRGIRIKLFEWEDYDAAFNDRRKQDEYNEVLKGCEMCLAIFWRRFGEFTGEELDTAYQQMVSGSNPRKIYVFFKTPNDEQVSPELKSFKEEIYTKYGHFFCKFDNVDTMKLEFLLQLENYQKSLLGENAIEVRQEHVYVGNEAIADLNNIPFAANNEGFKKMQAELKELKEEIEGNQEELEKRQQKQEKWKAKMEKNPDDEDFKEAYEEAKEEVEKLIDKLQPKLNKYNKMKEDFDREQQNLFSTARRIAELRGSRISERMVRAIEAFENGDAQRADTILDEAEHDADEALADIRMAKKVGLKSLEELILKASVKMANDAIPIDERIEETLKIYEKADALAKEVDYDKENYAKLLSDYGDFLTKYAKYEKAINVYLRQTTFLEALFGIEHAETATSYDKTGLLFAYQSKFNNALELFHKALKIREKVIGMDHIDTATSYDNIGAAYLELGDYSKASDYIINALSIREKILGPNHPDTAISYNNYGVVLQIQQNYTKSLEYYLKAQSVFEKVLGHEHQDTATSYNNIGSVYYYMGNYSEALEYHFKAVSIREKVLGLEHPDTAISYDNIGLVYEDLHEHNKVLDYHNKALGIRKKTLGDNRATAISFKHVGYVYRNMGNYQKALEYFNNALIIYEKIFGSDHTDTIKMKEKVEAMKQNLSESK